MASLGATRPCHALVELARPPPPARKGLLDVHEMMYALGLTAEGVPAQVEDGDKLDDDDDKENQDETTGELSHSPAVEGTSAGCRRKRRRR